MQQSFWMWFISSFWIFLKYTVNFLIWELFPSLCILLLCIVIVTKCTAVGCIKWRVNTSAYKEHVLEANKISLEKQNYNLTADWCRLLSQTASLFLVTMEVMCFPKAVCTVGKQSLGPPLQRSCAIQRWFNHTRSYRALSASWRKKIGELNNPVTSSHFVASIGRMIGE